MRIPASLSIAAAIVALALPAIAQQTDVDRYLKDVAKFSTADLASFAAGHVISKATTSSDEGEIAVIAAVTIRASRDRVASHFRQFVTYEDGQVTLQFGEFHQPPQQADVAKLTVPDEDIAALRVCKPGNCDVKIGGAGLAELQAAANFSAPDAAARVNAFVRQRLVSYVTAYMARGNAALVTYHDKSEPTSLAAEWQGILRNSPNMITYAPLLATYLEYYPGAHLPGGTDMLYWAKENYAGNVVLHADHMVTWQDPQHADRTTIAQKQIYASHYYNGSLAVSTIVDRPGPTPSSTIVYFNRSRGDLLKGGFGGVKRRVAESQSKKAAEGTLGALKEGLEKSAK